MKNGLNELADQASAAAFKQITRRINGGFNGLADRERFCAVACRTLGVTIAATGGAASRGAARRPLPLKHSSGGRSHQARISSEEEAGVIGHAPRRDKTRQADKTGQADKTRQAETRERCGRAPGPARSRPKPGLSSRIGRLAIQLGRFAAMRPPPVGEPLTHARFTLDDQCHSSAPNHAVISDSLLLISPSRRGLRRLRRSPRSRRYPARRLRAGWQRLDATVLVGNPHRAARSRHDHREDVRTVEERDFYQARDDRSRLRRRGQPQSGTKAKCGSRSSSQN